MELKMLKRRLAACFLAAMLAVPGALPARAAVYGDVDGDGLFDIVDVLTIRKWIHGVGKLPDARAADLDRSGTVDIFDLAVAKNMLVSSDLSSGSVKMTPAHTDPDTASTTREFRVGQYTFAAELMKRVAAEGENVLISPYSAMMALSMTNAGARGETRDAMDAALGGVPHDLLIGQLATVREAQTDVFKTANAIWVKNGYPLRETFLDTCARQFDAPVYAAPFDQSTVDDINKWVRSRTDRMVPHLIDRLADNAMVCLVDAVSFDDTWAAPYDLENAVLDGVFTCADGTEVPITAMHSQETYYLESAYATGFMRPYSNWRYAFVGILPKDGMTPEGYIARLDADEMTKMMTPLPPIELPDGGVRGWDVHAMIPAFSSRTSLMLNDVLIDMGMGPAFSADEADFGGMADGVAPGDLYIGEVLHKTAIDVNTEGTRAAAATIVEMVEKGIAHADGEPVSVILDRPFVYMIVDRAEALPLFIGTVDRV
ncbi:MAG: hypothetical protein IKI21_03430 [Oscillospiraceae bacterium]|nr:hypothetical protein [Oscillospiraceae bacterium]